MMVFSCAKRPQHGISGKDVRHSLRRGSAAQTFDRLIIT